LRTADSTARRGSGSTDLPISGRKKKPASPEGPAGVRLGGYSKELEFKTFPDELPRFYLAKWK
jgi:hypothetical protein